jgi:hypothetical protein
MYVYGTVLYPSFMFITIIFLLLYLGPPLNCTVLVLKPQTWEPFTALELVYIVTHVLDRTKHMCLYSPTHQYHSGDILATASKPSGPYKSLLHVEQFRP